MTPLAKDIKAYFVGTGLIDGFKFQYGEWHDDGESSYFVVIPDGGAPVYQWTREPRYRVVIIGNKSEKPFSSLKAVGVVAENLVEYIRFNSYSECHSTIRCMTDPLPPKRTESDRYMVSFNLETRTKG